MDWISQLIAPAAVVLILMLLCGYAALFERKLIARVQGRYGNSTARVSFFEYIPFLGTFFWKTGIFHPLANILKLLFKESFVSSENRWSYRLAPLLVFFASYLFLLVIPFGEYTDSALNVPVLLLLSDIQIGILWIFLASGFCFYGLFFLGRIFDEHVASRSLIHFFGYELLLILSVLPVVLWAADDEFSWGLTLESIVHFQNQYWFLFVQPLSGIICFFALLFSAGKSTFGMRKRLFLGYGGGRFALLRFSEYASLIIGSALLVILFLGGWNFFPGIPFPWPKGVIGGVLSTLVFLIKTLLVFFLFIWVRLSLTTYRENQILSFCWKRMLPIAITNLIFNTALIPLII